MENNLELRLKNEIAIFDVEEAQLEDLKAEALGLRVKDHTDKKGYENVKEFRNKTLVKFRTAIDKKRKDVKSFYLQAGKELERIAQNVIGKVEAIEAICKEQERIVTDYEAKIKAEEDARQKVILDARIEALQAVNANINYDILPKMSEEQFNVFFAKEKERFDKEEAERIAKEAEFERLKLVEIESNKKLEEERKKAEEANRELIKLQQAELAKRDAEIAIQKEQEAKRLENELKAKEAEHIKLLAEQKAKKEAQEKLLKESEDKKLVEYVLTNFNTLELAQAELVRLYKYFNIEVK